MFFPELPDYYQRMALFKVNTGTREEGVCVLEWADEVEVPELGTSVFIIPGHRVKNKQDCLIVLNSVARAVIDSVRGQHPTRVFVRIPKPLKAKLGDLRFAREPAFLTRMNSTVWRNARRRAAKKWEATTEPARCLVASTRAPLLAQRTGSNEPIPQQHHRAGPSGHQTSLCIHGGIKSFTNASVTIAGIELAHRIRKRQFSLGLRARRSGWSLRDEWTIALVDKVSCNGACASRVNKP